MPVSGARPYIKANFSRDRVVRRFIPTNAGGAPCYGGMWAVHSVDVPAVFGHLHYGVAYDGKDSDAQRNAADKAGLWVQVQRRMLEAWTAFAWTGNPSTATLQWPAYDLTSRATMVFDGESKVENNPRPSLTHAAASIF